ncbi:MAG: serine/threonine-protein kinase, partial [Planctomycetales bacterium]|nr:serine/threonine-protein kinase [Planctomycetales bacterium]
MMDADNQQLPLQQRKQVDALADQFEREFKAGDNPRIEDYLQGNPDLRQHLLRELLTLEIELRQQAGDHPSAEEYLQRFPDDRSLVEQLPSASVDTLDFHMDTDEEEEEPQPDRLGRYVIRQVLGRGGFGVVYLAHDPELNRPVALKVPRRGKFKTPEQVDRFLDEARTAANLKHPLIVAVYDVQNVEGLPCIVQEYIDGENLAQWSTRHRPSFKQIVKLLMGVADALGYAHQRGLTHCDLKLANVLMDEEEQPHVADFGLAVHENLRARHKGARFGTPSMMAPEQVRGEGHHLDDRTDIWALGVMMYELLVCQKPFASQDQRELFNEIETLDPRPPRQIDRSVPRELDRICLKCLSKHRSDRYSTTDDLKEDLQQWLTHEASTEVQRLSPFDPEAPTPADSDSSSKPPLKIIPKGLRSFDAEDADFFLELLPGPRDRNGLPESIRFWRNRIEEQDPDKAFSVGLIYGPSGCGKSSLVKAGLLPKLGADVLPVYVEATGNDTEVRILKQLARQFPHLRACKESLPDVLSELRLSGVGRQQKVLLVLDQFEQWLHAHGGERSSQLIDGVRQCDGVHVQCVVLVRDDFWMAATRFMRELEIRLVEAINCASVDLFDEEHARKVLAAFGRAYGKLSEELTADQVTFLTRAVSGLAQDGKVVCVRLALFADMMKGRSWTPDVLQDVRGTVGIGETFLEETFSASTAPPQHRLHEVAARAVLKALLPPSGADIKGHMQSYDTLVDGSGYRSRPADFAELIHILDSEIRLITPTDPEGLASDTDSATALDPSQKYYQLTHDYLVPSLRDWLTRKQRETRRGRAELRLEELSAAWNARPENRYLPNVIEWISIRHLTSRKRWTTGQTNMMEVAARRHAAVWGSVVTLLVVIGIAVQQY